MNEVKVSIVLIGFQRVTDEEDPLHDDSDGFHNKNPKSVIVPLLQKAKNKKKRE